MATPLPLWGTYVERRTPNCGNWVEGNFVNQRALWAGHCGRVAFFGARDLAENMDLELCAGHDGPFRRWVGSYEIVSALKAHQSGLA